MRLPLNNLTVLSLLCALGMSMTGALGTESFEQAKRGKFTSLQIRIRPPVLRGWSGGNRGNGKTGNSSLRMFGGKDAELKLDLKDVPTTEVRLSAWAGTLDGAGPL